MSSQTILNLVTGVVILGLLIYRQLRPRPVRGNQRLALVFPVLGLMAAVGYIQKRHWQSAAIVTLAGRLMLAGVVGAVRAATVRIWMQDGQPWMQGNLFTAVLWVLALGAHLGYDYLVGQHKDSGARRRDCNPLPGGDARHAAPHWRCPRAKTGPGGIRADRPQSGLTSSRIVPGTKSVAA